MRPDTLRHKGLRQKLVTELRSKGIKNEALLQAFMQVPRHFFLDSTFEEIAYQDKAFPINKNQTISQPYTVAYQTSLLNPQPREKVLEIGTGSGFQACILAVLKARVFTVERHKALFFSAAEMFEALGLLGIRSFLRDGYLGLGEFAPFDKILVTAAAPYIPDSLIEQLKVGGQLVIPVGDDKHQVMHRITKLGIKETKKETFDHFRFVPMLKGVSHT